jgi:hypothetical protein
MAADNQEPLRRHLTFDVAFRQIILEGDNAAASAEDLQQLYSQEAYARFIGASGGRVIVSTERDAGCISMDLEIRSQPLHDEDITPWDCVAEVSFEANDAELVSYTPPGDDLYRFPIQSGSYRVRAYVSGVETVNALGTEGQDQYRIVLWPAPYQESAVLQKRVRRRGVDLSNQRH